MNTFFKPLHEMAGVEQLISVLDRGDEKSASTAMISGCIETQKIYMAEALSEKYNYTIIVTHDESKARQMCDDARFFGANTIYYPAKDFIFYSAQLQGNLTAGERIRCISSILKAKKEREKLTVVTTIDALSDMVIPIERFERACISIDKQTSIDTDELAKALILIGYERKGMVDGQGQFAIRGGIIDIFSFTDEVPVRIELWDDEVDSIRFFDVESQRSIEKINEYMIFPATEYLFTQEEISQGKEKVKNEQKLMLEKFGVNKKKRDQVSIDACNNINKLVSDMEWTKDYSKFINSFASEITGFSSYFPKEDTLFVLDEPGRIKERMDLVEYEYNESMKNRIAGGYVLPSQTKMIKGLIQIYKSISETRKLILTTMIYKPFGLNVDYSMNIDVKSINSYNNSFEYLAEDLNKYKKNGYKTILVCNSRTRASRIVEDLKSLEIDCYFNEDYTQNIKSGSIMVTYGNIHKGFEIPVIGFVIIAENDIFTSRHVKKIKKKEYNGKAIASFNDLNIGDYVVHESHGLGIYKGIEKIKVEGVEKDYIKIEYADKSNLYVLATQLDRLQKYAGSDIEKKPKLNKLGGSEWGKTKSKVHGAVEEVAKDLVALYAARQNEKGYQFEPDTVWQKEFEEMFPYEETNDQLTAIEDTKRDMESTRIMDRLICGDVGYGKTEIAIRAAFKAVQEGKQVAYLVPTTILAQQVFNTFENRMKNFPVTVAELSSFRTSAQNKEAISEIKKGYVDIVIGTHRILSKDVIFKDLGLLIIDEEQRFGVTHKEKIKKLKNNIDVLTLSATPIPRTLHMSLVGIRDMSVLEEPPVDRIPIQTFVAEYNDEMVREAVNRELARGGQVYYVYNRVRNIDEVASHIQELVPDANVAYAHGQMDKRMLERIMYEFINGEIDVLVSTTIIETGMDISNCNTMIIENADKFGLSQLYQLRGRVGRSNRTAYAFLLYKRDRMISEVAQKRLSAIKEFSDLGSGFKIAMKDLEIRGAGNVLGNSQHGHMAAVGYDLYCKMLNQAVNTLKGIKNEYEFETSVDVDVDAFIPSTYIKSEYQKLDIYKRIAGIENEDELSDMKDELKDRYGSIPKSALNLLQIALIKSKAHRIGIVEIKGGIDNTSVPHVWRTVMTMYPKADIDGSAISDFIESFGGSMTFTAKSKEPAFIWRVTKKKYSNSIEYLEGLMEIMNMMEAQLLLKD